MTRDERLAEEAIELKGRIYRYQQQIEEVFIQAQREDAKAHAEFYAQVAEQVGESRRAMFRAYDLLQNGNFMLGIEPISEVER